VERHPVVRRSLMSNQTALEIDPPDTESGVDEVHLSLPIHDNPRPWMRENGGPCKKSCQEEGEDPRDVHCYGAHRGTLLTVRFAARNLDGAGRQLQWLHRRSLGYVTGHRFYAILATDFARLLRGPL